MNGINLIKMKDFSFGLYYDLPENTQVFKPGMEIETKNNLYRYDLSQPFLGRISKNRTGVHKIECSQFLSFCDEAYFFERSLKK